MSAKTGPEIRSQRVRRTVTDAIAEIKREIDESGGVYPRGNLTLAEIRRRAGVSRATVNRMTEPREFISEYKRSIAPEKLAKTRMKPAHIMKINQQKAALSVLLAENTALQIRLEEMDRKVRQLEKTIAELSKKTQGKAIQKNTKENVET